MGTRQLTGAALTASVIKKRLTALYPRIKFSVRSDTFANGNSVDICWTDGPTKRAVETITMLYQCGSFDGMNDMYNYEAIDSSLECDGAKYVSCHRSISSKYKATLTARAEEHFGELNPNDHSYYRRLAEIEAMFFPYPEAEPMSRAPITKGNGAIAGLEIDVIKDVDTRDKSELFVVKIKTKVDDFNAMRQIMKPLGGYYSRFKSGFIFRENPTAALNDKFEGADINVA